jgi:UDP-glucose 4-epimerase
VRELITVVGEVTGDRRPPVVEGRRPGDAPRAVASAERAAEELGWRARRGVRDMIASAWQGWQLQHGE